MKRVKVNFNFKSMALALFALALSSNVWGADWSYTFTSTESAGSKTWENKAWTLSISGGTTSTYSSSQGAHYGTNNNTCNSVTLTSSAFTGTISSIKIEASRGSSLVGTLTVKVGTDSYTLASGNAALTTSNAENNFTGSSSGNIEIKWTKSSGKGAFYIKKITITTAASKTLSSIAVKTAPSKVIYSEGDKFDPTGLVVTKKYSDNSTEDWAYASHASDFTFSPSTSTALTTSNKSVTITVGGKSTTQSITVNAKPKYTVTFYNAGEVVKTVSNVTEGTLFSVIKPTIGTGSGQLNIESCDNNSTHFMGWTKEESFQKRGSAPSYVADGTAINSDMELRAVWAAEQ